MRAAEEEGVAGVCTLAGMVPPPEASRLPRLLSDASSSRALAASARAAAFPAGRAEARAVARDPLVRVVRMRTRPRGCTRRDATATSSLASTTRRCARPSSPWSDRETCSTPRRARWPCCGSAPPPPARRCSSCRTGTPSPARRRRRGRRAPTFASRRAGVAREKKKATENSEKPKMAPPRPSKCIRAKPYVGLRREGCNVAHHVP